MGPNRGKLTKRPTPSARILPKDNRVGDERRPSGVKELQVRVDFERRSKTGEDKRLSASEKGKMKARSCSPAPKKRKTVRVVNTSSSEDVPPSSRTKEIQESDEDFTPGSATAEESEEDEDYTDDFDELPAPVERLDEGGAVVFLKPVMVDINGNPYGPMKATLAEDIRKMAKQLDPSNSWDCQPSSDKRRFFTRLYTEWDVQGPDKKTNKINKKWMKSLITKSLINYRWRLNQLIDAGKPRPPEVEREQWNTLVANRQTEHAHRKSDQMRSISAGKGAKVLQLKAIEKDALMKLSIALHRAPYDIELQDEIAREFSRQENLKRHSLVDHGKEIEEVHKRVCHFEGSMSLLDGKMEAMQQRMEDLFGQLLLNSAAHASGSVPAIPTAPSTPEADGPTEKVADISREAAVDDTEGSPQNEFVEEDVAKRLTMDDVITGERASASCVEKMSAETVVDDVGKTVDNAGGLGSREDVHQTADPYDMSPKTQTEEAGVDSSARASTRGVKSRPLQKSAKSNTVKGGASLVSATTKVANMKKVDSGRRK